MFCAFRFIRVHSLLGLSCSILRRFLGVDLAELELPSGEIVGNGGKADVAGRSVDIRVGRMESTRLRLVGVEVVLG